MSGLEMLFMDGGATVAGVLSAAAAVLGYKQQKEDDIELVDQPPDLEQPGQSAEQPVLRGYRELQ